MGRKVDILTQVALDAQLTALNMMAGEVTAVAVSVLMRLPKKRRAHALQIIVSSVKDIRTTHEAMFVQK